MKRIAVAGLMGFLRITTLLTAAVFLQEGDPCEAETKQGHIVAAPLAPQSAPEFTLKDVDGRKCTLSGYRGQACVIYFFCGCAWCQECSQIWSQEQQEEALSHDIASPPPQTIVVFAGDAGEARLFAAATSLDVRQTLLLPDPDLHVTNAYNAGICPRAFVVDAGGGIRYTNDHQDDMPRKVAPLIIVSKVLRALRNLSSREVSNMPTVPAPQSVTPHGVTIFATDGVECVTTTYGRYSFGHADALAVNQLEHTFCVRNDNKIAVTLDRLGSSCGCTSALVTQAGDLHESVTRAGRETSPTLLPGQKIAIRVTVDLSNLPSGMTHKFVWVYARGSREPAATLEIAGDVKAPVSFTPNVIDFGTVVAGGSRTLTLTARLDARLLDAGQVPPLVCTNPYVQILPNGPEGSAVKTPDPPIGTGTVTSSYTLRLSSKAAQGFIAGTVAFTKLLPRASTAPGVTGSTVTRTKPLGVPARRPGEVVGRVVAVPKTVVFDLVPVGHEAMQQLDLVGPLALLQEATARSSNPQISVQVLAPASPTGPDGALQSTAPGVGQAVAHLRITVASNARACVLLARVTVFLPDGTHLVVPVTVRVVPHTETVNR